MIEAFLFGLDVGATLIGAMVPFAGIAFVTLAVLYVFGARIQRRKAASSEAQLERLRDDIRAAREELDMVTQRAHGRRTFGGN